MKKRLLLLLVQCCCCCSCCWCCCRYFFRFEYKTHTQNTDIEVKNKRGKSTTGEKQKIKHRMKENNREKNYTQREIYTQTAVDCECAMSMRVCSYLYVDIECAREILFYLLYVQARERERTRLRRQTKKRRQRRVTSVAHNHRRRAEREELFGWLLLCANNTKSKIFRVRVGSRPCFCVLNVFIFSFDFSVASFFRISFALHRNAIDTHTHANKCRCDEFNDDNGDVVETDAAVSYSSQTIKVIHTQESNILIVFTIDGRRRQCTHTAIHKMGRSIDASTVRRKMYGKHLDAARRFQACCRSFSSSWIELPFDDVVERIHGRSEGESVHELWHWLDENERCLYEKTHRCTRFTTVAPVFGRKQFCRSPLLSLNRSSSSSPSVPVSLVPFFLWQNNAIYLSKLMIKLSIENSSKWHLAFHDERTEIAIFIVDKSKMIREIHLIWFDPILWTHFHFHLVAVAALEHFSIPII